MTQDNELYEDDLCPGACDFDADDPANDRPHTVGECGGPWKRQSDVRHGPRPPEAVSPEMVDAARAAYRDYQPTTLAKYSEAWQFARMRAALVAALSRRPPPERDS